MPTKEYKEPRVCICGYSTINPSNWSQHKKRCKLIPSEKDARIASLEQQLATKDEQLATKDEQIREQLATKDEQLATKDEQLATKDEQLEKQLAAKDEQIRELIQVAKKPRTVNNTNNRYVVEQKINVFGKESLGHIRPEQIESLLADPANAVSRFIKLKHQKAPGGVNANVRVPNQKRAIYQVVVATDDGDKEWENRAKGEVLEQLYDYNSSELEAEANEESHALFMDHQDLVKASAASNAADGGRRYKEQLDKIHMVVGT